MEPAVLFEPESHVYRLAATGEVLPGVTSVLRELSDYGRVPKDALERARQIGTAVHRGCELLAGGTLDWNTVHPLVKPRLDAYLKFLAHEKPEILWSEKLVFHRRHKYAGTADLGAQFDGHRAIIDFKTGLLSTALAGPQTAAYLSAKNSELMEAVGSELYEHERYSKRWVLQLREDGDYRLTELKDPADEAVFLSCLNIRKWRQKHGLR